MELDNLDSPRTDKAGELARELLGEIGLEEVSSLRKDDWLEVFVLLELERRYSEAGDASKAALYAGELDRLYPGARERWGYGTEPSISGEPYFALVLPMTGEGSEYASSSERGALAFERFTEMHESPPLLKVLDLNTAPGGLEQVFRNPGRRP
jgi:hypothetical protein